MCACVWLWPLAHPFPTDIKRLPPDCELQYPVWPLDEDEGFLSAAVEGGSVYVNQLVANFQLLAQGSLPTVLDLRTKTQIGRDEREALEGKQRHIQIQEKKRDVGRIKKSLRDLSKLPSRLL